MCTHLIEKSPLLPYFDRCLKRSSPVLLQNVQLLLLLKSSIQLGNSKTISPTVTDKGKSEYHKSETRTDKKENF